MQINNKQQDFLEWVKETKRDIDPTSSVFANIILKQKQYGPVSKIVLNKILTTYKDEYIKTIQDLIS